MNTTELLKQVRTLELSTKKLVDGLICGNYHSVFKGSGIEFSEIRQYNPGDDIRAIDWNVTARFNFPYVKEFIEERDLHVYFALDISGSSNFGSEKSKHHKALEAIASLMFAALANNDSIGLFLFSDHLEYHIPARKGKKHLLASLSTLLCHNPQSKQTNLSASLSQMANIIKKRSILFLISDFMDTSYDRSLQLLAKKHDVIAIALSDPREEDIPDIGLIELEDEESGEQILLDTSDPAFRQTYRRLVEKKQKEFIHSLRKHHIDQVFLHTHQDYATSLRHFFATRKQRLAHARI